MAVSVNAATDAARRVELAVRLTIVLVVSALLVAGLLRPIGAVIEDQRFGLLKRPTTGQVVLVDIDEASLRDVGVWPWSRTVHAAVVDQLRTMKAADIAFDVDFSSASTPEGDAAFEAALSRADGSVILAAFQQAFSTSGHSPAMIVTRPLRRFQANAWEGAVNVSPDSDGRVRAFSRGEMLGGAQTPSLAALLGAQTTVSDAPFLIDYGIDAGQLKHFAVTDLLQGAVAPSDIAGKKIIVGASAVELRDFFTVPRFGLLTGATVQALAAESLLQGRALQPASEGATLALAVVLLGLLCAARPRLSFAGFLVICFATSIVTEAGALWLQAARPRVLATAPVHLGTMAFVVVATAFEIRMRRIRWLASRRDAARLRIILDRVVADNFAGIVVVDQDGFIRAASATASTLLDLQARPTATQRFDDVLPPVLATLMADTLERARRGRSYTGSVCELRVPLGKGTEALFDCVTTVSTLSEVAAGADDYAVCLTFQDITEKRDAQLRLAEMARTDSLTGLANRYICLAALDTLMSGPDEHAAAVLLLDIDRFKQLNDRLGHAVGDALIVAIARRVRTLLQAGDVAARLDGDEFALIVTRPSRAEVEAFAATVVAGLGGGYDVSGFCGVIAISAGYAFAERQGTTALLGSADAALHAAKMAGGAQARLYDDALREAFENGKLLERDLAEAMGQGQFEVVYQRQVDIRTDLIVGVEALVRWRHPERGYISPAKFIPVAERTGLIVPLGQWVLETACRDALAWPVAIKMSVNLSAVQLARSDLAAVIIETLHRVGLPAHRLDLELTESLLMEGDAMAASTFDTLRAANIGLSLDDFGTGYSSLSYLRTFPIDKIKVDQSFIRGLPHDQSSTAIIRAIIALARDLGLRVNAEGVETTEQMTLLRLLGCDEVQGYLHGKPEPASCIHASLAEQSSRNEPARHLAG